MDPYSGEIYAYGSYPSYDANDYQAVGATEPGRFVDPLVSTVYEPGSVFKMMTATAALGDGTVTLVDEVQGRRHAPPRRRQDEDRQREPPGHGRHEVQGRDRVLAQRRRRQGRAEARAHDGRGGAQAVLDLDPPRVRGEDRPRRRPRGRRPAARPGQDAMAPDRPRQRRVRPGRRGDPDAARAVVRGDGQRRRAGAAAPRQAGRHRGGRAGVARPGDEPEAVGHAGQADAQRDRHGRLLPRPDVRSRATTSAARRARPRSGTPTGRPGRSTSSTTRSSATSGARRATPTSSSRCASRRGRRPSSASGSSRCR